MNNYIVTSVEAGALIGGNKAKNDVVKFLTEEPEIKSMEIIEKKGKVNKLLYSTFSLKKMIIKSNADNFILQYPVASEFLENSFLRLVRKETNAKFYLLIHDISSLQYPDVVDENFQERELSFFKKTDGLIVHNEEMRQWLLSHGVKVPMVKLGIFDYQIKSAMQKDIPYTGSINFAGGLGKANFLQKLKIKHEVHIMGPNKLENYPDCVKYDGQFLPSELSKHLLQNFGLVWSGNSINTCSGYLGQYLRYNDPHKLSLYLSEGIPVIIWDQAALAKFVKGNNVGIAISNLNDLDQILDGISFDEYQKMKHNAQKVGKKIRQGSFIKHAVTSIINESKSLR